MQGASAVLHRHIHTVALVYCKDAKLAFHRMSNAVQLLAAVRHHLTLFLNSSSTEANGRENEAQQPHDAMRGWLPRDDVAESRCCFGCSSRLVLHALALMERVAHRASSRRLMLQDGLLAELMGAIMHAGSAASRRQARAVICVLVRDDPALTSMMLRQGILAKVDVCLEYSRALPLDTSLRNEMQLLMDCCREPDKCWELKYKTVMHLLFKAVEVGGEQTAVASSVILPVLDILVHICCRPPQLTAATHTAPPSSAATPQNMGMPTQDVPSVTYQQWQAGTTSYEQWQQSSGTSSRALTRQQHLARKYAHRWLRRWRVSGGGGGTSGQGDLLSHTWIRKLLLNRCSQAVRSKTKTLLAAIAAASPHRALVVLDLVTSMLGQAAAHNGQSAEIFTLITELMQDESYRLYAVARGFLAVLCHLITDDVARIRAREHSCSSDIAQGLVLKNLLELLGLLLQLPRIRRRFKESETLLNDMLDNFLHVQSLIVQKTKLIDDCAKLLRATFASISSESEQDKRRFCMACVLALEKHRHGRTAVFLLEQLSSIMCPVKTLPVRLCVTTYSYK